MGGESWLAIILLKPTSPGSQGHTFSVFYFSNKDIFLFKLTFYHLHFTFPSSYFCHLDLMPEEAWGLVGLGAGSCLVWTASVFTFS